MIEKGKYFNLPKKRRAARKVITENFYARSSAGEKECKFQPKEAKMGK
jgi:hypothetical protein